ncbi:nuclease-related domain-containing protein [Bacillus sp. 1P06AnD]|uniref:nuclease-related domain-containing protein n=1 Tax=Bacillus sp. 1P06AnD TaxID=3132208 RepID=UPI0039A1ED02
MVIQRIKAIKRMSFVGQMTFFSEGYDSFMWNFLKRKGGEISIKQERRRIPIIILQLEALLRRLPAHHFARIRIKEELAKCYAGFRGEQAVDYQLTFVEGQYELHHDVRLPFKEKSCFQMDFLLLTPYFILIIEVKNIVGTLVFDRTFHQLIRTINEKEESFPDPILQVKKQTHQLQKWLQKNKLPEIPIEYLVCISNPSTYIKSANRHSDICQKVTHAANLPFIIADIQEKFSQELLSKADYRKINRLLVKQQMDANYDVLKRFQIDRSTILSGILCPSCNRLPLQKQRERWYCTNCATSSKSAHIQALIDFRLLIGSTITNKQLREFLHIPSTSVASKILSSLKTSSDGTFKNRVYHLSIEELQRLMRSGK